MRFQLGNVILALQSSPVTWQICGLVKRGFLLMILVTLTLRREWINNFKTPFPITNWFLMLFVLGTLVHYNLFSLSAGRMKWT